MHVFPYLSGTVGITSKNHALDNGYIDVSSGDFAGSLCGSRNICQGKEKLGLNLALLNF
jgi:hypothetical protein